MKLYVDTNGKQVTVTKDPVGKNDGPTDRQKTERGTGRPMWSKQVFGWTTTAARSSPSQRLAKSRT